jgi:hypothetical protein
MIHELGFYKRCKLFGKDSQSQSKGRIRQMEISLVSANILRGKFHVFLTNLNFYLSELKYLYTKDKTEKVDIDSANTRVDI